MYILGVFEFILYPLSPIPLSCSRFLHLRWCTVLHWCFSRSRKYRPKTEKPKFVRGDRLGFQRTLVDLILNAQAIGGEPPPSTMAIVVEDGLRLSSIDPLYDFHPEVEKTLRRLRKARNLVVNNSRSSDSVINTNQLYIDNSIASSNIFVELGQMENNDRTLKELATLDVLELAQTYELKSGLIHLLPKFHGLAGEDPYKHLKEFHMVCSTMRPQGIPEDYIKMKTFPFSLDRAAKDWLYLQPVLFNT
ncbi:hypothetical protein CR513_07496, partial [Mucuna pruriens]